MTIRIVNGIIVNYTVDEWVEFKKWLDGTHAKLRYVWSDDGVSYTIIAVDEQIYRAISIVKTEAADFESNYKSKFAQISNKTQDDGVPQVAFSGRLGNEVIYATHNFCDPTTWYSESIRVTNEILVDSGNGLVFNSNHENWIDMTHGKVLDEEAVAEESDPDYKYLVTVTVDNIDKIQRNPFAESGGDYDVNYTTGQVTFFGSQSGKTVKASYNYANGSTWVMKPSSGKQLRIEQAEAQFSGDVVLNDTIKFGAWGLVDVFAPQLVPDVIPSGTLIELLSTRYQRLDQIIDEALGSYPVIPAIGGSQRGNSTARYGFPFRYGTVRVISSSAGMELRVRLENDIKYGGERATATFYCLSENE